jgi:hypothetical protein
VILREVALPDNADLLAQTLAISKEFVPYWSNLADMAGNLMINALANDVVPSRVMGRFFGGLRTLGLAAGMAFNFYLFKEIGSAYGWILLVTALVTVIAMGCFVPKSGG